MTEVSEIMISWKNRRKSPGQKAKTRLLKRRKGVGVLSINPLYEIDTNEKPGYTEAKLDLNELLVKETEKSFLIRVSGDSMSGAGIETGDILLVDCGAAPEDGKIVVAAINDELLVKRIRYREGSVFLEPENENYSSIKIDDADKFDVWGVVSSVIKMYY